MEIISLKFALSAIASFIVFYLLNPKYRIGFLTVLSCGFIASYNYLLLIYVVIYALINYIIGIKIPGSKHKIALFRTGIILNLSQLILLRYSTFAIDPILQLFHWDIHVSRLSEIIVPIGISYFTLQGIGYLINTKMGWEKPEKNFVHFLLYLIFFPKFLSGPIERSNHFIPQLKKVQVFNEQQVADGLRIALFGFFKKVAIANQIAPFLTGTYSDLSTVDGSSLWIILFLQPLYLYFDFSGYTDIAIGFAKTFGIGLLPNFERPFFSENMTVFWRRFHISLSAWFNDYIFKQTSFKRRKWGIYASVYALLLTWTFFGIWHGAGWNFMMLGFVQALAIIYEFFTKKWRETLFSKIPGYFRLLIGRMFTFMFYGGSLVFFFSPNINTAFTFYAKLFDSRGSIIGVVLKEIPLSAIIFMIVFLSIELVQNDFKNIFNKLMNFWLNEKKMNMLFRWVVYSICITILFVLGSNIQEFIYAQF